MYGFNRVSFSYKPALIVISSRESSLSKINLETCPFSAYSFTFYVFNTPLIAKTRVVTLLVKPVTNIWMTLRTVFHFLVSTFYLGWGPTQFFTSYSVKYCSDNLMPFLPEEMFLGLFSMFFSERAVLRLLVFFSFLFRLVPCELYFLTLCWIVFLQDGS